MAEAKGFVQCAKLIRSLVECVLLLFPLSCVLISLFQLEGTGAVEIVTNRPVSLLDLGIVTDLRVGLLDLPGLHNLKVTRGGESSLHLSFSFSCASSVSSGWNC